MRTSFSILAALVLLAGMPAADAAAASKTLRMGGTGSSIGMLRQVGGEFAAAAGGVKIIVIPSLGSSGGIHALADGKLDVAVSARPLKPAEAAKGLRQVLVLRTAYVLATSHRKPNGLKTADLPKIFSASKPTWADGTPIRLILRPRSETDTKLLGKLFPGMDKAIEDLRRRAEVPIAATDQDNADMAERLPGSLTGTTLTQTHDRAPPLAGRDARRCRADAGEFRERQLPVRKASLLYRAAKRRPRGARIHRLPELAAGRKGPA